ncbi:MAG: tRNA modification GTPase [Gemmataceae bacterium]
MLQGSGLPDLEDLIVALASATGPAPRAVIRLSGKGAASVVSSAWRPATGSVSATLSTRWTWGDFLPAGWLPTESIPAMARMWRHGTGYTGQEAAEIHCLGSVPGVEAILRTLNNLGARGAGPGEFTLRAFLAGRVDLVRAEALVGLTHARSAEQLADALDQHAGGVSEPMARLREELLDFLADIEAGLDFADEDIAQLPQEESLRRLSALLARAALLAKKMQGRAQLHSAFRVALVGVPNAGKSTLFNQLAGLQETEAAIVSDRPGTTRDWLSRLALLPDGTQVEWIDTAGWQEARDLIGGQAQELGRVESGRADLVLVCKPVDLLDPQVDEEYAHYQANATAPMIMVHTRADLGQWAPDRKGKGPPLVSARTGQGIADLQGRVEEEAKKRGARQVAPHLARAKEHLGKLIGHLRAAHGLVLEEDPVELVALEVRAAVDELGTLLGTVYSDDLLGRVFSRFCIGK